MFFLQKYGQGNKSIKEAEIASVQKIASDSSDFCEICYEVVSARSRKFSFIISCMAPIMMVVLIVSVMWSGFIHHNSHRLFAIHSLPIVCMLLVLPMIFAVLPIWMMRCKESWQATLRFSSKGITFNEQWRFGLLNRLERSWDDLHSVQLVFQDHGGANRPIIWRGQKVANLWTRYLVYLSPILMSPKLIMDFKSGGSADILLSLLSRQEAEKIFRAIEKWGDPSLFSTDVVRLEKSILLERDQAPSVTQLWEDDFYSRYAATNYVPLPTNHVLQSGRYKILMELAAGGMSAVYLAEDGCGKKVVLKEAVAPPDINEKQRHKTRELFEREAILLTKLRHSQIARVLDHFIEDNRDYLVLEYIPGRTLRQLVKAEGKQKEKTVLNWTKQICEILCYLHSQEPPILHRDLTPDNLIVRDDGSLVLVDFGAANEFIGSATGTLIGKQCYISPEQLRGKAIPQSDLYSLGATLYFLLTAQDPLPLSQLHPKEIAQKVSAAFDQLVANLTEFDASGRLQSAQQVAKEVEKIIGAASDTQCIT